MKSLLATTIIALQPGTLDQVQHIPTHVWINIAIGLFAAVVLVKAWRALKNFNSFAPWIVMGVAGVMAFFYMVYNRTEPAFLTPLVDRIAQFMPTKPKP